MKDRPRSHRDLVLALTALVQLTRTVKAILRVTASGTTITLWPSKLKQMLHAGFLDGKPLLKLYQTQLLLLHRSATSPLTSGCLVILLRTKGNNPFMIILDAQLMYSMDTQGSILKPYIW